MGSVRVGILGGGQLSRLLCLAGRRLGIETRVLSEASTDPAAAVAVHHEIGSPSKVGDVSRFAEGCDVILFENEFVPGPVLDQLAELGSKARPGPQVIREVQNKLHQKRLFKRLGLPSSPYVEPQDRESPKDFVSRAELELSPAGLVLKWAELGYDGKGTCLASGKEEALAFAADAAARGRVVYAEAKVDFRREVALVASRAIQGDLVTWPLVITRQEKGVCREVMGPARNLGVAEPAERELSLWAARIGEALGIQGTFALELFEDAEGRFWLNEMAPRVHNSGHWTLDGSTTSQFENHLRACLGLPLGRTEALYPAFVMRNLLGPAGVERAEPLPRPCVEAPGLSLYWYEKTEVRPGRKMGHLNAVASEAAQLELLRERLREVDRAWEMELGRKDNA